MQASKIKPKHVYAIRRDDVLKRFYVESVVTRRIDSTGSPHDYKSEVVGTVEGDPSSKITLQPDAVLGRFEEYAELVERKRQEKEAVDRATAAREAAREHLWSLLYSKTGLPRPNNPRDVRQPFQIKYSGIDVDDEGIKLLTELLQRL